MLLIWWIEYYFVKPFGKNINIYDQRMKNIAIKNNILISYSIVSCISETYQIDNFYFGIISWHLLDYDLRLNTIIKDFTYNEDTPIFGIMPYLLNKYYSNYDLSSIIKSSNYYVIWTAPSEHEIVIWNSANMHCDLLLKVNTLEIRNEFRPLTVEIHYLKLN